MKIKMYEIARLNGEKEHKKIYSELLEQFLTDKAIFKIENA